MGMWWHIAIASALALPAISAIVWWGDHVIVVPSLGIKAVAGMSSRVGMSLIPALRVNAGVRF